MRCRCLPFLTVAALLASPLLALPTPSINLVAPTLGVGTVILAIDGVPLTIERPSEWREGGVRGFGIVHSFIGDTDGLPAFSVQHDPGSRLPEEATEAEVEAAVEELFVAIVSGRPGYVVDHAGWATINGLRVHSSLSSYQTVAGPMTVRRLILTHERSPYIFAWTTERDEWQQVSALVERCVSSLQPRAEEATVAD